MSHDTDKLIRQLSLVAFLMAELRPLTARDVKQNVEGYSEMSDEAFARRFYSDRSELLALGVPLESQRDEFTGEELYTLRSEHYFLPPLELTDDELAALQTCLYLLEGQFAYAEPFRLALQNLALGRPDSPAADPDRGPRRGSRPRLLAELAGRLSKLETAISKQRTLRFDYWSIARNKVAARTIDPYALLPHEGSWYVIGRDQDLTRSARSACRGSAARFASRRGASGTSGCRPSSTHRITGHRPCGRWASSSARRASRSAGTPPGGSSGRIASTVVSRTTCSSRRMPASSTSRPGCSAWTVARSARAGRAAARSRVQPSPCARAPRRARTARVDRRRQHGGGAYRASRRPGGARALRATPGATRIPPRGVRRQHGGDDPGLRARRAVHDPGGGARGASALLNLVNFGGGCYAVYAELPRRPRFTSTRSCSGTRSARRRA